MIRAPIPPVLRDPPVKRNGVKGFSLVELLAVVALMSILAGMAVPALRGLGGAQGLAGAGGQAAGFFASARQNSISKGVLTAVVVLQSPDDHGYRTLVALELATLPDGSPGEWRQASKWEQLPRGVVIENTPAASNFLTGSPTGSPALPPLTYGGRTYQPGSDYAYQIFLPSGQMKSPPSPCNLTLVEGVYEGNSLKRTGLGQANYFNLFFVNATGETKITRP